MKVNCTLVSVQSGSPDKAFGQLAKHPLKTSTHRGLLRASIPTDIPSTAIVTKAELVFTTRANALTGTRTVSVQPISEGWKAAKATWNNQPAVSGAVTTSATIGAVPVKTEFRVNIGTDVQAIVSGTLRNRGWRLTTSDTSLMYLYGTPANQGQPYLDLEYVEYLNAPVNLSPNGGATSVDKPVLTFDVPDDDLLSVQVQVDVAADPAAVDWDSGEVPASGGMLALADTTYPGLAVAATTYWRTRAKNSLGWSDWSDWATLTRVAKPAVTITGPASTTGDTTPTVTATMPGMVAYEVYAYRGSTGTVLAHQPRVEGTSVAWTPTSNVLKKLGDTSRIVIRAWDNIDRAGSAAAGDQPWSEAEITTTLVATSAVAGTSALNASLLGESAAVRLNWDNTPTPDEWQITRDGDHIARVPGADAEFIDYSAAPLQEHVYQVLPVTAGAVSPNGPSESVSVNLLEGGIWLVDPDTGDSVILYGQEQGGLDMPEQAVIHDVLGKAPVRRRSAVLPPAGSESGPLVTVGDTYAEDQCALLLSWKVADAGKVYRLVKADWNLPVTIGNVVVQPLPQSKEGDRMYAAAFSWWQDDSELLWA